jgi:cyclohexa-1,5-dienecarbonyl-CoA hydratase
MSVEIRSGRGRADIRLKSPPRNVIDFELMHRLSGALDEAADAPLLILSSALGHFSVGVDIKIHTPALASDMLKSFHEVLSKLYHHEGVTVCLLNGYALGGGMELALVCDFIFAKQDTVLGFPEIRLACFPPVASILLPRKIGGRASNYLYTGKLIDATAAEEIGVVEGVFSETPDELLEPIKQHSLTAMCLLKKVLRKTSGFEFDLELKKAEEIYLTELIRHPDVSEGVNAFLEKRAPLFTSEE